MKNRIVQLVLLCGIAAGCFFWGRFEERLEQPPKKTDPPNVVFEVQPDEECRAALAAAVTERDFLMGALSRASARITELELVVLDLNKKNVGAPQPLGRCRPLTGERVELPADADNWYTSLFVQADYASRPNELAAVQMFDTTNIGVELKGKTHFKILRCGAGGDAEASRYYAYVPNTPCLMIQRQNGEVLYREVNADLAKFPPGLRKAINKTTRRERHHNQPLCPGPDCRPQPQPAPGQPVPKPTDVILKKPEPAKPPESHLPAVVTFIGVSALTAAIKFGAAIKSWA